MGRRCLYHTSEQKLAANRAKSKRSYERRKEEINKHRRMKYAKDQRRSAHCRMEQEDISVNRTKSVGSVPSNSPINVWLERADRIGARLQKITGNNAVKFLHSVMEEFLEHCNKDVIHEKIVTIGRLQKSIYRYENEVLMLVGMGGEYDRVKGITQLVCEVIRWLEEVLCQAMVDVAEVGQAYNKCQFEFQKRESHMA